MSDLHIVEISPHIYAGAYNKKATIIGELEDRVSEFYQPEIYSGGISFIFNKIKDFSADAHMVFIADRNPTIKKNMDPNYKGKRNPDYNVNQQKEISELVLNNCGFQVMYEDGYEADDIIWSLCQKYKKEFDHIYVHTGDSDIYVVVDDNVSIMPSSSRAKRITKENYETTVKSNAIVPYNSISFAKVLYGDVSDNIPRLPKELANKLARAFFTPFYYERMGNKQFIRNSIAHAFPEAVAQFDLVYPLDLEVELEMFTQPDYQRCMIWGHLVGNAAYKPPKSMPTDIVDIMKELFSGKYTYRDRF